MGAALEGLKILDVSLYGPVPFCTMILGDLVGHDINYIAQGGVLGIMEHPGV